MSQVVTLKRTITKERLRVAVDEVEGLSIGEEHDWGFAIECEFDPNSFVTFSSGEVAATSPSNELLQCLGTLATLVDAEVLLEDEMKSAPSAVPASSGRGIVVFWPALVLLLVSLLVWRW